MKNLKNMLFAAAIGAVLVPMVASAESCTIKDDKTVTVSADCELAAGSNVKTITVNADKTLTITGTGKLDATFAGSGDITVEGDYDVELAGTFTNQNITGKTTILLDPSETFKVLTTNTITKFAVADGSSRYAIYSDAYKAGKYTTYTCDKAIVLTDDAVVEASKNVYVNSASGDYTFKLPAAFGNYAYISANTAGTLSDDKKSVVVDKNTATSDVTITVNTGKVGGQTQNVTVKVYKPATDSELSENDAVVAAIVDDYVTAMNKDSANPSFTTKVSGGSAADIVGKKITTAFTLTNATNDIKAWAAANGYTVLQYFTGTAKADGVDKEITVLPVAATVNVTADQDIVLPTAAEGKKVELVVLDLHGDTPEVVDNAVVLNANNKKKFTFKSKLFSPMALAYHIVDATPAQEQQQSTETNTGDATKEANPKTSDNVMTSVVSLLVSAFGLTAAGLKLKNN